MSVRVSDRSVLRIGSDMQSLKPESKKYMCVRILIIMSPAAVSTALSLRCAA